jgi:uncharacterized protein (TIGR02246 family)
LSVPGSTVAGLLGSSASGSSALAGRGLGTTGLSGTPYADLFTADGVVMLGPMGKTQGRENIHALMSKVLNGRVGAAFHIIGSPQVEIDGDSATAEVMWTVIQRDADGKPKLSSMGRHVDRLRREDGVWRIAERRGLVDLPQRMDTPTIKESS